MKANSDPACLVRSRLSPRHSQIGQASVFIAISAVAILVAALMVYNAGQLSINKMKLQTTADAAAYSGAVLLSRAYNFAAYANRSMVAQQVAVGQMVGLVSWSRYYCLLYTLEGCGPADKFITTGTGDAIQITLDEAEGTPGAEIQGVYTILADIANLSLEGSVPAIVTYLETLITVMSTASQSYYAGVLLELGKGAVNTGLLHDIVADNDPEASISSFGMGAIGITTALISPFMSVYAPQSSLNPLARDDGSRFHDLVVANLDSFSTFRTSTETFPFPLFAVGECQLGPEPGIAGALVTVLPYTGSTALSADNKGWSANDEAILEGISGCGVFIYNPEDTPPLIPVAVITPAIIPPAFGGATLGESSITSNPNPLDPNRLTEEIDASYSGLQTYLDVTNTTFSTLGLAENKSSPSLTLYVKRDASSLRTTQQLNDVDGHPIASGSLQLVDGEAGSIMQVGATSDVEFQPPDDANTLGGQQVYGSLFSPYWEPHLSSAVYGTVTKKLATEAQDSATGMPP